MRIPFPVCIVPKQPYRMKVITLVQPVMNAFIPASQKTRRCRRSRSAGSSSAKIRPCGRGWSFALRGTVNQSGRSQPGIAACSASRRSRPSAWRINRGIPPVGIRRKN